MAADLTKRELCLDPLTVLDCTAEEGVAIAAATGCGFMSLWVQRPGGDMQIRCIVEDHGTAERVRRSMGEHGVRPLNLEVFDLTAQADVSAFRPALEIGAMLGVKGATAVFRANPDANRRLDQFVELCQLAAPFNLRMNVEFLASHSLSTLQQAADLLAQAGQPNVGIVLDILHLMRSGGSVEEVRQLDPHLAGHAQLCDGPATIAPEARIAESAFNRMVPGEGDFPVRAFCEALPPIPIGLEVPYTSVAFQGLTPLHRVQRVVQSTRRVMAGAET